MAQFGKTFAGHSGKGSARNSIMIQNWADHSKRTQYITLDFDNHIESETTSLLYNAEVCRGAYELGTTRRRRKEARTFGWIFVQWLNWWGRFERLGKFEWEDIDAHSFGGEVELDELVADRLGEIRVAATILATVTLYHDPIFKQQAPRMLSWYEREMMALCAAGVRLGYSLDVCKKIPELCVQARPKS